MINKAILLGNLGRDPEIRTLNDGGKVAQFSLATSERWTDRKTNERQERTEWHRVVVFDKNIVQTVENYLQKGSQVYVEGKIQTRKYTDQQNQERFAFEIVLQPYHSALMMVGGRGGQPSGGNRGDAQSATEGDPNVDPDPNERGDQNATVDTDAEDDIPF